MVELQIKIIYNKSIPNSAETSAEKRCFGETGQYNSKTACKTERIR